MRKSLALLAALLTFASPSSAIINPNFTPRHLVEQADLVVACVPKATADPLEWQLSAARPIKGKLEGDHILSLARCNKDDVQDIQQILKTSADARAPLLAFVGSAREEQRCYLHVGGLWLDARPEGKQRWEVRGHAPQLAATYAGGTDMLLRMSEYLVSNPDAFVPVSAGVRWIEQTKLGSVAGEVQGMEAVELGEARRLHLFVASPAGDRLFRPRDDTESFDDVTAKAGLDTRSRRFVWLDVNRDGLADLVSWDGASLSARLADGGGAFKEGGEGWAFRPEADCTGLAPCPNAGRPGVLVSTHALPVLLAGGPRGWTKETLPEGRSVTEGLGQTSPCIVADLDNDGCADVLEPGERAGTLWKGKPGGFEPPVRTDVSTGEGIALAAVGDFDGNGALDLFLAGTSRNSLWENDGKGRFKEVLRHSGSMSYKCPPGARAAWVMDLNHDGWPDICLGYEAADLLYHFNRGFRAFGEEGEVRLTGPGGAPGEPRLGVRAVAPADFNGDASQDLAVALSNGDLWCYFNEKADMPGLRLRLAKGAAGPVTASCWMGEESPVCTGAASVVGHSPPAYVAARHPGKVTIRYRLPGGPPQTTTIAVEDGTKDVVLVEASGK